MNPLDRITKGNIGGYDIWYLDGKVLLYFDNPRYDSERAEMFENFIKQCKEILVVSKE